MTDRTGAAVTIRFDDTSPIGAYTIGFDDGAPVGKAEFEEKSTRGQRARDSRTAEWSKLLEKKAWHHSGWQEWSNASVDARRKGRKLHIGRLFGI